MSHTLHHWHLSPGYINILHSPVMPSLLVSLLLFSSLPPRVNSLHTEVRAILWKHQPTMSLLAFNHAVTSFDPIVSKVLPISLKVHRISALATSLICSLPLLLVSSGHTGIFAVPCAYQGLGTCSVLSRHAISLNICLLSSIISNRSPNKLYFLKEIIFAWLSLLNRHPTSSYTISSLLLYFLSQLLSLTGWTLHNYLSIYLFSPSPVPWQPDIIFSIYFPVPQHSEQCLIPEDFILSFLK